MSPNDSSFKKTVCCISNIGLNIDMDVLIEMEK